jgi:hypothetical protein
MAVNDFSEEASTPATPTTGRWKLYPKSTGWYFLDDAGVETSLTAGLTSSTKLPTVGCTQAAGALTFTAASMYLDFRSTTLTSGTPSTVLAAPSDLVLPSGGTLGTVTTVQARLILVELNNAGAAELAIINLAGGNSLDETGVINTTAIGTGSDSNNVFYSTTARTGVAYRVVGAVDVVNTAGAWGNPVLVQGAGGNALTAMSSLGYGQTWQNVTVSRALGTTYYNTTGKPIHISVCGQGTVNASSTQIGCYVNSVLAASSGTVLGTGGAIKGSYISVVVPNGAAYRVDAEIQASLSTWSELR